MSWLLNIVYAVLLMALSPVILWRNLRHGRYRQGWTQKLFGVLPKSASDRPVVWFHAVSVGEILQDTRADAMAVFAAVKLHQGLLQEAEMLLQLAHDAHVQAGDMEQIVVDLVLMADVELHSGNFDAATYLLFEAETILTDECDSTRHLRCQKFRSVVHQRLISGQGEAHRNRGDFCLN